MRNIEDADVENCLKLLTFLPMEEVNRLSRLEGAEINKAKEILAFEFTKIVHGEDEAQKALDTAKALFAGGAKTDNMPTTEVEKSRFDAGVGLLDLMLEIGLIPSKGEGRRLIQQRGISVNDVVAVSVNGDKEETDYMRGEGVYEKVLASMERMKERNLLFGMSLVLTRHNYGLMTDPDFYMSWRDKGVVYAWNFLYMPVGRDPEEAAKFMPSPEQRYKYGDFIQKFRNEKPIYIMDFWADAPFVHGCIAGGRRYLHINHRGDVEPCIFAHFATDNIREKSLLECLKSPFFTDIRAHQPHTDNLLRPCMIIDNPQVLRNVVKRNGAKPTHEGAEVIVNEMAPTLDAYAEEAARTLDPIWEAEWQKRIVDMETRGSSYGEGIDRLQGRIDKEGLKEKMDKLEKNDPEYAKLIMEKEALAQADYDESPIHKKIIREKKKVTE